MSDSHVIYHRVIGRSPRSTYDRTPEVGSKRRRARARTGWAAIASAKGIGVDGARSGALITSRRNPAAAAMTVFRVRYSNTRAGGVTRRLARGIIP